MSIALTARAVEVDVRIVATDIDEATLDRARRGNFANHLPDDVDKSTVETILGEIDFRHAPLPWPDPTDTWELFDIIFCRNVLIYFSPADATALLESVATRLAPQGLLVVSPVEALLPLPPTFVRRSHWGGSNPGGPRPTSARLGRFRRARRACRQPRRTRCTPFRPIVWPTRIRLRRPRSTLASVHWPKPSRS